MAAASSTERELVNQGKRARAWLKFEQYRRTHRRMFGLDGRPMSRDSWYGWQHRYFAATRDYFDVLLMAANQVGKSQCAGYADAVDLTGDYPDWWEGHRFTGPIRLWLLGVSSSQLVKVLQRQLFGELMRSGRFTGGWVHPDEIVDYTRASSGRNLADTVYVRHRSGGVSEVALKSYTQIDTGQDSLPMAGEVVDKVRCDEQPPDELIGQLTVRTANGDRGRGGKRCYTLTPEQGMTGLIVKFMRNPAPSQILIGPVPWSQAPHITPERQKQMLANIPEHEHEMRSLGVPMLGSGRIFRYPEESLLIDPFPLSSRPWLRLLRGIDIGIDHPTAITWLAFDPEDMTYYLVRVYRRRGIEMEIDPEVPAAKLHAAVANSLWPDIPLVTPHDFDNREPGSGLTVASYYQKHGIKRTLPFHNCDEKQTRYREPGILAMQTAMSEGRFKVFRGACEPFMEEYRLYHRKDGKIVREMDDTIDATRYPFQMIATHGQVMGARNRQVTVRGRVARG